jgi:hypothetical protein
MEVRNTSQPPLSDRAMIEYLIRRTDGEWFDVPDLRSACRPITVAAVEIEGWGDARIRVGSCEVSFSYEDPGIQVSFDGEIEPEVAQKIVTEVLQRISEASGQAGTLLQISW